MTEPAGRPDYRAFSKSYDDHARELHCDVELTNPLVPEVPPLLLGRAVWDTGATNSVIRTGTALLLGLVPTGETEVITANGRHISETFVVDIRIPGSKLVIPTVNVSEAELGPRTDMLIGMDVIAQGDFTVQSRDGRTVFAFVWPPFPSKYDIVERADRLNGRRKPPKGG